MLRQLWGEHAGALRDPVLRDEGLHLRGFIFAYYSDAPLPSGAAAFPSGSFSLGGS
jgi:hypothetical protein